MARMKLTARFVESVTAAERADYWDELVRGLVLRVSPSGVKAWTAVYRRASDGAKRRVTLGKFPTMTLDKARARALAVMSAAAEGEDPAGKRRAQRDALTVRELGALFVEKHSKRNKRTWREDERLLRVDVEPIIGAMKIQAVKRRDIADVIDAKADAGRVTQSTRLLALVRKLFAWAVENDYLDASPVTGVKPRGKPVRRERVLGEGEIATIFATLPQAALSAETRAVLQLLFYTGQRSGEVCGMRASEIDLAGASWLIPAQRTKNARPQLVPLAPPALAIIAGYLRALDPQDRTGDKPLFSRIGTPIESNAIAHAVRRALQLLPEPWTPHDIRRTVATGMASIGIAPHVIEAVLNHVSGFRAGVAGTYNRHGFEAEKRAALEEWALHLDRVVARDPEPAEQLDGGAQAASNVIPIRARL
jgi:integrase